MSAEKWIGISEDTMEKVIHDAGNGQAVSSDKHHLISKVFLPHASFDPLVDLVPWTIKMEPYFDWNPPTFTLML